MAARTASTTRNGSEFSNLAAALATLLQNQAHFVAGVDEDRKRFARIEHEMFEIKTLLLKHDEILKHHDQSLNRLEQMMKDLSENVLKDLPEAIRKKIGFHKN